MKNAKLKTKGFTLIELLVVIAIIGLLSSIVIASLGTARAKAKDAAIQSQLSSIRAQAEIYYSNNNNTYGFTSASPVTGLGQCTDSSAASMFLAPSTTGGLLELVQAIALQVNGTQSLFSQPLSTASEGECYTSPGPSSQAVPVTDWVMAVKGAITGNFYCADNRGTFKAYNSSSNPTASQLSGVVGTGATDGIKCN